MNKSLIRLLPKVDECVLNLKKRHSLAEIPDRSLKQCIRTYIDILRKKIIHDTGIRAENLEIKLLLDAIEAYILKENLPRFKRVINCTGVIIHTNLGRSLLPAETMAALSEAGCRYSNLEFDLDTGKRGSRYSLVEKLICDLTGAEASLVVNNNAAAVFIALQTLAAGKEVIVSRGQLVEIGGSFRIPDIMSRSGASLVEVGATNRTHLYDYEEAISKETGLLLKVHCSNYRIIGFTSEVSNKDLAALGKQEKIPVMEDLGSGCLVDLSRFGLMKEPTVQETVASGMDVVTFSGDKLLGGPQAGIIVGRKDIIDTIKKNPLNRALRIDKFTLSGLESVLRIYMNEEKALQTIPTLAMISTPVNKVKKRARRLINRLDEDLADKCRYSLVKTTSRVGGGAMPEQNVPSAGVTIEPFNLKINELKLKLRQENIPVIARIEDNRLLLDLRTVADDEINLIHNSLLNILSP
jgi:L-seryl-tRNA(Ser) seleniumtransferase